ncbi:hypothetical protein [Isoptericola sp. NPDC055881]
MTDDVEGLGIDSPKHPAFAAHFTDPIYDDPANDIAPFGNDEGWDMLASWSQRADELGPTSTVLDLLEDDGEESFGPEFLDDDDIDAAMFVVGAAFALLRLTGQIDAAGRGLAMRALDVLDSCYDRPAEVTRMREDLLAW